MDATCSSQFAVCSWKHVANDHEQAAAAKKSKAKETQEKTRQDRTRQANAKDNAAQLVHSTMLSKEEQDEEKEKEEGATFCTGLAVPMFGLKQVY